MSTLATGLALGRYRLGPLIGRGATSSVRRAVDERTGREVAVKTVPDDPDLIGRVRREVRAAERLDHPHVVRILDWGRDPDCLRLVWELVDGPSLREVLASGGVDPRTALRVAVEVLDALDHAHARGVVHRDVKPANVLIDADGAARLGDFGVARVSGEAALTMVGSLVGTVAYMAPEQARGEQAGPPADVYATCLVLHEALTGASPLAGGSPAETARRAARADVPSLAALRPDLPAALHRAVAAGLRPRPEDRPSAAALRDALAGVLRSGDGLPLALPGGVPLPRWAPGVAGGLAAAGLAAVALSAWTGLRPGEVAVGAAATGALTAVRPGVAAAAGIAALGALLARTAPGLAAVVAALAALLALAGRRDTRLLVAPLLAPAAVALGLLPLALAAVGLVPRWGRRLWVAVAGLAAVLVWQLLIGASSLLLGSVPPLPGVDAAAGERDPLAAVRAVTGPLADAPWVGYQAAVVAAAALLARAVVAAAPGRARAVAAALWAAGLVVAAAAVSPDPAEVAAVTAPSAMLVALWALRPWRHLARLGGSTASGSVRGPSS